MAEIRYLVTGGAGFIGSNLAAALVARGDNVRVLDNLATGQWALLKRVVPDASKVESVTADIRDHKAVQKAMEGIEVVFHQAALGSVPRSVETPIESDAVNTGGTVTVTNATGTININGGTVDLKSLNYQGGTINFTAGSLSFLGNLTVGTSGLLGSNLLLNGNQQLTLSGATTVDAGRKLTLDGGTLSTGNLIVNGSFIFIAGTLGITQAGASINTPIVTGNPSTININANNVSLGSATSFSGFDHQGTLNVGSNAVTLNSAGYARLGVLTTLDNGTINAPNGVAALAALPYDLPLIRFFRERARRLQWVEESFRLMVVHIAQGIREMGGKESWDVFRFFAKGRIASALAINEFIG
jgi:hypothetical protein